MNIGNDSGSSGEVELNLAPILDCLTVLVAFLLASASFLSLSALESGVAAESSQSTTDSEPPVPLFVHLRADGNFKVHFDKEATQVIPKLALVAKVLEQKAAKNKVLIFSVDPSVPIQTLIDSMSEWRRVSPGIPLNLTPDSTGA